MILAHAARAGHSPWDWHPHYDVWLLVVLLSGGYALALRRLGPRRAQGAPPAQRRQVFLFSVGVLAVWVSSDWPLHDLAEGPMYSLHMVQHLVLTLVAPPLLLAGTPAWLLRWLLRLVMPVVRVLVRPLVALLGFNLMVAVTHWPVMVDLALDSGAAHFAQHLALVASALAMWWPVVSPLPELGQLHPLTKMLYLFGQSLVPTVPASFLTWGSHPLYHGYERFPKLWGVSAATDQQVAGLIMKIGGGLLLWGVILAVFFRWYAREQEAEPRPRRRPAAPATAGDAAVTGPARPGGSG